MKKLDLSGSSKPNSARSAKQHELLVRLVCYIKENVPEDLLVFKDGLFLGEHTKHPRYTQDVDVSLVSPEGYPVMRKVLEDFGRLLVTEGTISSYDVKSAVVEGRSGGAKYRDIDGRVLLSTDVSLLGSICSTVIMDTSTAGRVCLSSVEQMLADKLTVLYSQRRFRRAKDLFDAWQIISFCQINGEELCKCLQARGLLPLPIEQAPFNEDHYEQMEHAYDTLTIRDANTGVLIQKPTFDEIVNIVGRFTMQFMEGDV